MNMNTCNVMKAEAMASGAGAGAGGCSSRLSAIGRTSRRELPTPNFGEKNLKLRVDFGKQGAERENVQRFVCRAIDGGKSLYQPFRPPISIEIPAGATTTEDQLEILRERRGLWHEYASLIPLLSRSGYNPSMIDEATGMTGVEQNIIVGASQVRNSLKTSGFDEEKLRFFDLGGGELLYELRILSATQRKASAEFIIERKMSPKEACELARSVKDFDRRRNSEGYKDFTSAPGDCLAFAFYRQSIEFQNQDEIMSSLEKALLVCVSDKARAKLEQTLKNISEPSVTEEPEVAELAHLQVIRLLEGEAVGTELPTLLPVADATLKSLEDVPALRAQGQGLFNVFSTAMWPSWVALPGWAPVVGAGAPVAVNFPDAAQLPLKSNRNGVPKVQEPTLVIVDKSVTAIDESQSLYVVAQGDSQDLSLVSASKVLGSRVLGRVILALRPPTPPSEDPVDWE